MDIKQLEEVLVPATNRLMNQPAHKTEGVNRTKNVRFTPFFASDDDLQWKADKLFKQSLDHVNHRVLDENDLDCIMGSEFAKEEFGHWIDGIPCQMKADVECDHGLFKEMVHSMLDDRNHGVYFYHSDHLGSASWITDSIGIPIQHLQYLPYGEPYIDQRAAGTTYRERFRFTGKEKDEETGYGYFGARYMDHELLTSFLSIDRYASKYPSISPYAYCAWNPIKLIDPTGDTCKYASKAAENYILQLLDSENDNYSKEFSDVFQDLKKDSYTYIFEIWNGSESSDGDFSPQDNNKTAIIKFTSGETRSTQSEILGMSEFKYLFEETYHAWKYMQNDHRNVPSCYSEALAWKFSALAPGTKLFSPTHRCLTVMGYIYNMEAHLLAWEFKYGFMDKNYPQSPLYPKLPVFPDNCFRKNIGYPEWK